MDKIVTDSRCEHEANSVQHARLQPPAGGLRQRASERHAGAAADDKTAGR